jgi:hypothetical protein
MVVEEKLFKSFEEATEERDKLRRSEQSVRPKHINQTTLLGKPNKK